MIKEMHLFAGIGGGIYGGRLLGHQCVAGVEIDEFCQSVLRQRQADGWMDKFDIYGDITKLNGADFIGTFDVLCGGFPCQAFSTAAHGQNIPEKNLWFAMRQFIIESDAPVVFGENVTYKAIDYARNDLIDLGYKVKICRLSCGELGADHQRNRFWLLAYKDDCVFGRVMGKNYCSPQIEAINWTKDPASFEYPEVGIRHRRQLKAVGNAQSPFVAAAAFRILVNRHVLHRDSKDGIVTKEEIAEVFNVKKTWIKKTYGEEKGMVHTPTTIANYTTPSMQKHQGCRNYVEIFGRLHPMDGEYLMGFPIGASYPEPINQTISKPWEMVDNQEDSLPSIDSETASVQE